ncbi:MAG: hypothetical protein U0798_04140 [Gemmataceae bacterium]
MTFRRPLIALALFVSFAETPRAQAAGRATSTNFVVTAPTQELAQKFVDAAEYYRVEKAREWLGHELPAWSRACPITVRVTMGDSGGATTFTFEQDNSGRSYVASRKMEIKGKLDALLDSVLPHEITHTIFAEHFGRPVPRWADEGGSVLSENDEERTNHDIKCRQLLNAGRGITLRVLFAMKEYPDDMIVTYAEGFSVSQYLIDMGGRKKFLEFVGLGMQKNNRNWEEAVREMYGFSSVNQLEQKWIESLHKPRTIAAKNNSTGMASGQSAGRSRSDVRSSAAPGLPVLDSPVTARGTAPDRDRPAKPYRPAPAPAPSQNPIRVASGSSPDPVPLLLPPETPRR